MLEKLFESTFYPGWEITSSSSPHEDKIHKCEDGLMLDDMIRPNQFFACLSTCLAGALRPVREILELHHPRRSLASCFIYVRNLQLMQTEEFPKIKTHNLSSFRRSENLSFRGQIMQSSLSLAWKRCAKLCKLKKVSKVKVLLEKPRCREKVDRKKNSLPIFK